MEKIIYIKTIENYEEITREKSPAIVKKIVFWWKKVFVIITKKVITENREQWLLPYRERMVQEQLEKIIKKQIKIGSIGKKTKIVFSNMLNTKEYQNVLKKYQVDLIDGTIAKRNLLLEAMNYINQIQKKKMTEREITILVNQNTEENQKLIKKIALHHKLVKVVSKQIYQFKKLEEKLYEEHGIALQFSNSHRKSLKTSEIIINIDFDEIEINEYQINPKAIILNLNKEVNIKSKAFQGVIINSYQIKFSKELEAYFKQYHLYHSYEKLLLYESMLYNTNQIQDINGTEDIKIQNLIGKNGIVDTKEFKNLA